ncbi:MAG: UDP-N-acetylmuramate--L-alanine ligase [Bacteroidetes bacterium]|nr:UDP-N-acetylmuramate--L-alanine ligase [Bacteroidota bacterium]MCY4205502.1 UDP-N-acetylmuramate--L-alanine ligase [Bacteroidota bacterium]
MRSLADFADANLRIFDRPPPKPDTRDIYLIGICGTGMGALAGLLNEAGYSVRGSDNNVYPPMSTFLEKHGIPVHNGFSETNLSPFPDLVIPGNSCTPTHVEATLAREASLPQLSFPEALNYFFLQNRRNIVVAGTHGKTTTAGMLVHLFRSAGRDPGFLVGGVLQELEQSFSIGTGPHFVIEGDEYDSAYFDKYPKFLHYAPQIAIVTSIEFDHADIYSSMEEYQEAFDLFTDLIPANGLLVVSGDAPATPRLHPQSAPVLTYGLSEQHDVVGRISQASENGIQFNLIYRGRDLGEMILPMNGHHNLRNALAVSAVALHEGLSPDEISHGLATFPGVKRRQEILGEPGGILVIDDFAHHPTAVRATIQATTERWPNRRLLAVFEPRSNSSRRKIFENSYGASFTGAASAYICSPPFRHNDVREQFMDIQVVLRRMNSMGTTGYSFESPDSLLETLLDDARAGDVILIMSNGSFSGLHQDLLTALSETAYQ